MSDPEEQGNKGKWIAAGASVIVAIITTVGVIWHSKLDEPKSSFIFSGIVKQTDGNPIPRVPIQISLDQETPQSTFSDSDGVFHVELPASTHSMHISIYASGFDSFELDASPHRTGPEIIYLNPVQVGTKRPVSGAYEKRPDKEIRADPSASSRNGAVSPSKPTITTYGDKSPIVTGNGSSVTYNDAPDPRKPVTWYLLDGETKTVAEGGSYIALNSGEVLENHNMDVMWTQKEWADLVLLAEKEKAKNLPWYSPYYYAGIGYGNLCMINKAEEISGNSSSLLLRVMTMPIL
jgi:hypothetical protein